jgi:hypothetical protein
MIVTGIPGGRGTPPLWPNPFGNWSIQKFRDKHGNRTAITAGSARTKTVFNDRKNILDQAASHQRRDFSEGGGNNSK